MYLKCILDSFGIRVKYMQNVKIHVFSLNVTEHVRYVWDTSRYMYPMRFLDVTLDTCQDTSGYMYLGRFITIHQDTPRIHVFYRIHSRYITIHQDTYRIGNPTKSYRKPHLTGCTCRSRPTSSSWRRVRPANCDWRYRCRAISVTLPVKHTTRTLSGPPSTRAAIAMDGGVADTACYYTGR